MANSTLERSPRSPEVLRLVAHPLRWMLLGELARSDRQVRELTACLGERQSLVSYHLGRLRAGGLVRARRSSFDGRDAYYTADLASCADLLGAAGAALHPGLRLALAGEPATEASGRVLFLCTGNSARSPMAEALLRQRTRGMVEACSAGSRPTPLHPNAVRVMRDYGIDLSGRRSQHFDELTGRRFDWVVTLCDRVREVCPEFPGPARAVHWSLPNPAEEGDCDGATYPAFERTARELDTRIRFLIPLLSRERQVCP
jgi:ArsR family transcriptional regulator, arsenate/arsenite/antimonite-responsive transcriptional repressor / arsenate reductase (thioredoxin)